MVRKKEITIALAGNPNSGKTTIFNNLTGMRQHVGNYPGVTVEKKTGIVEYKGYRINVVDLPGTYSLTAYSEEEIIARNFIVNERPDVVVDVIDTSNLERNMYLAVQLMELNTPLVLAFNMVDVARKAGKIINTNLLSELLGVSIVETIGSKGVGSKELLEAVIKTANTG
ncbi:MAG: FeoB small GTPase domain-containing protein, partial [Actinomycetota bacterium]|nr:FeoB small GTPase domain-containing protein [Actinomycetota bacterium]